MFVRLVVKAVPVVLASSVALLGSVYADGDLTPEPPVQYRDKPFAAEFASANDIWVVGDFGLMLHSPNGGELWRKIDPGTTLPLYDVFFTDPEHGVVVGAGGLILVTDDGGSSWMERDSGVLEDLLAVDFLDDHHGFAVGLFSTVVETEDGGKSWTSRQLVEGSVADESWEQLETQVFESPLLNDVVFIDDRHGWIVGEYGVVFATEDAGATWERQRTGEQAILFSVAFQNPEEGWVTGLGGLLLHTTDGGETWTPVESLTDESLYHIALEDGNGVVVGDAGTVLSTSDGGATWRLFDAGQAGVFGWLRGAATPDGETFVVIGAHGAVLISRHGGIDWERID